MDVWEQKLAEKLITMNTSMILKIYVEIPNFALLILRTFLHFERRKKNIYVILSSTLNLKSGGL